MYAELLVLSTVTAVHARIAPAMRRANIVLVYADDLGSGELGCYGQTHIKTPHIDRLAAEGARLTTFSSAAPVCAPARSALFTGQHLGRTPVRDNSETKPEGQGPLPAGTSSLANDLREAGYLTACIGTWGLGFVGTTGDPNSNGFDLFFGYNCQRQAHNFYPTHLWRNSTKIPLPGNNPATRAETIYAPDLMLAEATRFIECAGESPFFLAYTSTLPHLALQPTAFDLQRYAGQFDESPYVGGKGYLPHPTPRAAYAAMITRLDAEVGALRDAIERAGHAHNTIIVVTSDNGPTHDVGGVDTSFFVSTGELRGRKGSLWEGGVRVPCVAWWPGRFPAGMVINDVAWSADLRVTFGALAGTTPTGPTDGIDLSECLAGLSTLPERALYWETRGYGGQQSVREGRWKIIRTGLQSDCAPWQLFDLAEDASETRNLADAHPEIIARLATIAEVEHTPSLTFPLWTVD